MAYKITISARAEETLDDLVNYLETEWTERVRNNFLNLLEEKLNLLAEMPFMYEASAKRKEIRKCLITKQTTLFYRIKENEIEIITIQDNRRDPEKSAF